MGQSDSQYPFWRRAFEIVKERTDEIVKPYVDRLSELTNSAASIQQNAEDSLLELKTQQQVIDQNEATRGSAEQVRQQNEATRGSAEQVRQQNEATRGSAEQVRQQNEATRGSAEQVRQQNEDTRGSAEQVRQQNEDNRQSSYATAQETADSAKQLAMKLQTDLDNVQAVKQSVGEIQTAAAKSAEESKDEAEKAAAAAKEAADKAAAVPSIDDISETVNEAIQNANHLSWKAVDELPSLEDAEENVVYAIPSGEDSGDNHRLEYILQYDSTDTPYFEVWGGSKVDLSGYSTTVQSDQKYVSNASLPTTLSGYYTKTDANSTFQAKSDATATHSSIMEMLNQLYGVRLRFKNLGTQLTSAQAAAIAKGDFSDLLNGDYWVINGITWRIVDNTGWGRRRGDTEYNKPYLVIMPDQQLLAADGSSTHFWNATDTTAGGYAGSAYRSTYRAQCRAKVDAAFGSSHVGVHRELICNSVANGKANNWAWADCDVELPSEAMVYGASAWGVSDYDNGFNIGTAYGQLALFRLAPQYITTRYNWWLRDVVSSSWAARVGSGGTASRTGASSAYVGVRPYFYLI